MKTKLLGVVAVFTLFATSLIGPANADLITWDVSLSFDGGGTGSGSFMVDASTHSISDVDITTGWAHYTAPTIFINSGQNVVFSLMPNCGCFLVTALFSFLPR
jgi:hypothetical protein